MILRCTQKLLKASGVKPETAEVEPEGLLGEWYANLVPLPIRGRSVVMFSSAATLVTVVAPGRVLKSTLPVFRQRLPPLLERLCMPPEWIAREMSALGEAHVTATRDRRVLGQMNELADWIYGEADDAKEYGGEFDLTVLEIRLAGVLVKGAQGHETAERRLHRLAGVQLPGL